MDLLHPREPISTWTHFAGLLLAIPGTFLLLWRSPGDNAKRLSLLIYGLTLIFCYTTSTLYHGVQLPAAGVAAYARLDGVAIFALIAGTYTPLAWSLLRRTWRIWTLAVVWTVAISSTAVIATGRHFSIVVATSLYLGMGWGAIACYAEIARDVSHRTLFPIVLGGVFYSVGAIFNVLNWPDPYPGIFGYHELFHLFVLAGSFTHYLFILKFVVPLVPPRRVDLA
jgi:hemolysin III